MNTPVAVSKPPSPFLQGKAVKWFVALVLGAITIFLLGIALLEPASLKGSMLHSIASQFIFCFSLTIVVCTYGYIAAANQRDPLPPLACLAFMCSQIYFVSHVDLAQRPFWSVIVLIIPMIFLPYVAYNNIREVRNCTPKATTPTP